ncbi:MAG: hypothetical protein IT160_19540 [Bryobacterales bacterium]|nr:hypothetical protein [Bryobacterales bacterium]
MKFTRRTFIHGAGAAPTALGSSNPPGTERGKAQLSVGDDGVIHAETATLTARIEKGFLTSLRSKASGEEFITGFDTTRQGALHLIYARGEAVDATAQNFGKVETRKISDQRAEVTFENWNVDGVITVSADPATGDLVMEPAAYSSRPGVRSCRWSLMGLRRDLKLVAPFFQGISLRLDDPLIRDTRWEWPLGWEAGLAIFQAPGGGFSVHAQDTRYRYKSLQVGSKEDPFLAGFDTDAYGPIDNNLAAGGLAWRINVHKGGWEVPAARYRDWLWEAYSLAAEEQRREPWLQSLGMAISWCPGDIAVLEELVKKVDPRKVLIHFPRWRSDPYDVNYPTYTASESGAAFIARARQMGFHVMPHFNLLEVDPNHPVYAQVRDFQYRHVETKKLYGWSLVNRRAAPPPESNAGRLNHQNEKVMVQIHPGLSRWRSILRSRVQRAASQYDLREVFADQSVISANLHNALVENVTSTEGAYRLLHELADSGLAVGGEGLNETTFAALSFAQVHLFKNPPRMMEGFERTGGCALNHLLFGRLCRSFGYNGLGGHDAVEELRARLHEEHGAMPTITIRSAEEISDPTPDVERALDHAR